MPEPEAVTELVVLYDADCPLCRWVRGWLGGTPLLVPLRWVPCGSEQARRLLPWLDHDRTRGELTVVGSGGRVWTAGDAWIVCLWATAAHRGLAQRLATPAGRPTARAVALAVA
ncbi:DCC1-like thiol-disulfide oxidoreductase family protein, partial [Angustibacter aerolatus]